MTCWCWPGLQARPQPGQGGRRQVGKVICIGNAQAGHGHRCSSRLPRRPSAGGPARHPLLLPRTTKTAPGGECLPGLLMCSDVQLAIRGAGSQLQVSLQHGSRLGAQSAGA